MLTWPFVMIAIMPLRLLTKEIVNFREKSKKKPRNTSWKP